MPSWVRGSIWTASLALLLLLPAAHAGAAIRVEAERLDLRGGGASGLLSGAAFLKQGCGGLGITGTVAHVRLEVDTASTNYAKVDPGQLPGDTRTHARHLDFDDALLTLSDPHAECRVVAWMDPGMQARVAFPAGAFTLQAAPALPTTYQPHANGTRPLPSVGGPDLLRATGDAGLAEVTGNLRLSVWDATLDIHTQNGSFHAVLGQAVRPLAPVVGVDTVPSQVVDTEAFLWLTGARLAWTLPPSAEVLASAAHLDSPGGTAELRNAVLVAGGSRTVAPLLTVDAPRGDLHAQGTRLLGAFDASSALLADGQAVGRAGSPLPLWPLATGGLLLISVAGGRGWALREMRRALDADDCGRAAGLALAVWPPTAESRVARVVCLLRLGRLETAERALRPQRWRAQQATRSFLQARLEATRGDAGAARRHLAECFLLAPAFVADARADLALHGIVEAALGRTQGFSPPPREGYA